MSQSPAREFHPVRPGWALLKGTLLFIVVNLLFAILPPAGLGRVSVYNSIVPGRERLPFGESPAQAYNLSLFSLDAMFASHEISGTPKSEDELRVVLIGDSSVWGTLLRPNETLSGQLNAFNLGTCDGRQVHVYNLGYPTISLTKDLLLLDRALGYSPDLVIWPVTLEAFPMDKQLSSPLVAYNAGALRSLIEAYGLEFDPNDPALVDFSFWDRTLIGQRRNLADIIRLQLYGFMWAATGVDQVYPEYTPAQVDLDPDLAFHDFNPPMLDPDRLAFDILAAGHRAAGGTPILLINEPMLVSDGINSDLRYNFFYPIWAYDQYRQQLEERSQMKGWDYLDLWNIVPAGEFTNSAIHMTPAGESLLASRVGDAILERVCQQP